MEKAEADAAAREARFKEREAQKKAREERMVRRRYMKKYP